MELHWIRRQLALWGRICRAIGPGYPTMSSHEKARVGRGGVFDGPTLPDDLAELDTVVARIEPQHKLVIVECYTKYGTHSDHMVRLQLPESTYFRRKKIAEQRVYSLLRCESELVHSRAG